jgi:Heterokaryon incompatibility protein (HET)
LSEHLREIPLQRLPKTFQDSIALARGLDIPHLWIDSLCIIQDDNDDWSKESPKMGVIYEFALFTIAASAARDSTEGLFVPRLSFGGVKMLYHAHENKGGGSVVAYLRKNFQEELNTSPLSSRAWVLQEDFLSRRTIHFLKTGIIWSCKQGDSEGTRMFKSDFGDDWVVVDNYRW